MAGVEVFDLENLTVSNLLLGAGDEHIRLIETALCSDFESKTKESGSDFIQLISDYSEICVDGMNALQKMAISSGRSDKFSAAIKNMSNEHKAYSLLINSSRFEMDLKMRQRDSNPSTLLDLIAKDTEMRKLMALLDWCEEAAFIDAKLSTNFIDECVAIEDCNTRSETLHMRRKGEKYCNLDLDGALHGRLHVTDEATQLNVYRTVFQLIRCGQLAQAETILNKCGLASLTVLLQMRGLFKILSSINCSDTREIERIRRARSMFKSTVDKIFSKGTAISQAEKSVLCAISGRTEPLLSMCSNSYDRLWCLTNAAVISRIDQFLQSLKAINGDIETVVDCQLTVSSLFSEVCSYGEDVIYFRIYEYLLMDGDSADFVDLLYEWFTSKPKHLPYLLRFMTHLILILIRMKRPISLAKAEEILLAYTKILSSYKLYHLVPFYLSQFTQDADNHRVIAFMQTLPDEIQSEVLVSMEPLHFDIKRLCQEVFDSTFSTLLTQRNTSEFDENVISTWKWLTYPGDRLVRYALFSANDILLILFEKGKLEKARDFLDASSKTFKIIQDVHIDSTERSSGVFKDAIAEYVSYFLFMEAHRDFHKWFRTVGPYRKSQDMESSSEKSSIKEQYYRHFTKAMDSLKCLILKPGGWLTTTQDLYYADDQRVKRIEKVRIIYLENVLSMILSLCEHETKYGVYEVLLDIMGNEKLGLAKVISKSAMREFLKRISKLTLLASEN